MMKITKLDLIKVSLRLMFVQSAWTSTTMQSEGFVYCITPALKKLFTNETKFKRVLKHYSTPINTHPFLVSVLAGAAIKMEEEGKSTKSILTFLKTTMGPLAALGDPFFQTMLAFASVISAVIAFALGIVPAILSLLILFNTIHIGLRINGILIGYKMGDQTFAFIGNRMNSDKTNYIKIATGIVGGMLICYTVVRYSNPDFTPWLVPIFTTLGVGMALILDKKRAIWTYVLPLFLLLTLILEVFF